MAAEPPLSPGYAAEYIGHELRDVCIVFAIIQTCIIVSLYTSKWISMGSSPTLDTLVLLPLAYLLGMGLVTCGILIVIIGGAGHHIETLELRTVQTWLKINKAVELLYVCSIVCSKLALVALYLRIFISPILRWLCYITTAFMLLPWAGGVLSFALGCRPFAYSWNKTIEGHCVNIMANYTYFSIPNVISDLALLLLPLPTLYKLQVPTSTKPAFSQPSSPGAFSGLITAIIRFIEFATMNLYPDATFKGVSTVKWTIVESGMYHIAATLPSLRPLLNKLIKRFRHWPSAKSCEADSALPDQNGCSISLVTLNNVECIEDIHVNGYPDLEAESAVGRRHIST